MGSPDLAGRIRAGDEVAIRAVVETYADQVYRTARGSGMGVEAAEDVTQNTFAAFVESAPRFEGRSHVRTWLFGILYRKLAEARRENHRERWVEPMEEAVEQRFLANGRWGRPPQRADARAQAQEARREIGSCLEGQPIRYRMAFLLREVEGLTTEEIAKVLGVTPNHLGVLLYRVRNRLRECLESKGFGGGGS